MKLWRWLLLPTVAALALLLHGDDDTLPTVSAGSPAPLGDFAPGELLVKVRPGLPESTDVAGAVAGARAVERIPDLDVVRIDLPPEMEVAEAVELYERLPWVGSAEPNYYLRADVVPNDPGYPPGWPGQQWYYDLIQAPAAWDITTGSPSLVGVGEALLVPYPSRSASI